MLGRIWHKITDWEQWPFSFHKLPIVVVWIWSLFRSRSIWFFSSSNPTLEFGGFEGERKREMYDQLPFGSYPLTTYVAPDCSDDDLIQVVEKGGFTYPFAVKPDVGMKGLLFRKITSPEKLLEYHRRCPVDYVIQEWVDYPIELSVFYIRKPGANQGRITGMTWKEPILVVGNGNSSLLHLMKNTPRAAARLAELCAKHAENLDKVLPEGEQYLLTLAANRQRGARLHNLKHEIDEPLTTVFDQLSLYKGHFYWGRFDVKCTSLADLRAGKNFKILEFNGAGAAPNHIYHAGLSIKEAWRDVFMHWQMLFEISSENNQKGIKYWPWLRGWQFLIASQKHFKLLEKLDKEI